MCMEDKVCYLCLEEMCPSCGYCQNEKCELFKCKERAEELKTVTLPGYIIERVSKTLMRDGYVII